MPSSYRRPMRPALLLPLLPILALLPDMARAASPTEGHPWLPGSAVGFAALALFAIGYITAGYAAGIVAHLAINRAIF